MFYELKIKDMAYKCRLDARASVELEKDLGKNPLQLFVGIGEGSLPRLEDLIKVLQYAIKKEHKDVDAYDVYDAYCEDGHSFDEFILVITDIFQKSGFIKVEDNSKSKAKSKN
jgi:hypothetical protein